MISTSQEELFSLNLLYLLNRYTVVSGSFRKINGRKVRTRKGHLRRKRR